MQRVSGAIGLDVTKDPPSEQREIANQIKNLMADKLVPETQGRVVDPATRKDHAVVAGSATNQPHIQHRILLFQETEGAGCCNVADVAAIRELDLEGLAPNQRMWEVNRVTDRVA